MSTVQGLFFDGVTSSSRAAVLVVEKSGQVRVTDAGGEFIASAERLGVLRISSRLGNVPRTLDFPDGGRFETLQNEIVDQLEQGAGLSGRLIHRLESRYAAVILSLMVVGLAVWWFVAQGVPALARGVAFSLPESVQQEMGRGSYELLNEKLFTTTTLSRQERLEILQQFASVLDAHAAQGYHLRIHFHHSKELGANAVALPSGDIIFTDDMVRLAENSDELMAILLHEIAHVVHRHSLRQAIQASSLMVAVALVTGDVSSLSSVVTTIPVVLTQLGYSRQFELEADDYALDYMLKNRINPGNFVSIMRRMQESLSCEKRDNDAACKTEETNISGFLSTHPETEERLRPFLEAAEIFPR